MKTKEQVQAELNYLKAMLDFLLKERDLSNDDREFRSLAEAIQPVAEKIYLLEWVLEDSK